MATIKMYMFAVRAAQLDAGNSFEPWRSRHSVFMTLRGVRRVDGDSSSRKAAITIDMLWRMAKHVDIARKDPRQKVLISAVWAAMLVGFFGMLRKDNSTAGKNDPFNPSRGLRTTDMDLQPKQLYKLRYLSGQSGPRTPGTDDERGSEGSPLHDQANRTERSSSGSPVTCSAGQ
eukprot:2298526-Pyramimonas_sp.AAC.1